MMDAGGGFYGGGVCSLNGDALGFVRFSDFYRRNLGKFSAVWNLMKYLIKFFFCGIFLNRGSCCRTVASNLSDVMLKKVVPERSIFTLPPPPKRKLFQGFF